jgi:transposase InsO family protein
MEGIRVMVVPMRMGISNTMPMNMQVPRGNCRPFLWRVHLVVFRSLFVIFAIVLMLGRYGRKVHGATSRRPSPTWRSFLRNEAIGVAAIDMFVALSASFRLLYVMAILADGRRKIVRFDVTQHPTAVWLSQQVIEAFPWDTAPGFLLRDRDASYGSVFSKRVAAMGITEVVTAPRSPWQNAYVERVAGSIRQECLDQVVIFNERHLRRVLSS